MRPICIKCGKFFKVKKIGLFFEEGMPGVDELKKFPEEWKSYKLWRGDIFECKGCGFEIIGGIASQPASEHYMGDYKELRQKLIDAGMIVSFVGDCP